MLVDEGFGGKGGGGGEEDCEAEAEGGGVEEVVDFGVPGWGGFCCDAVGGGSWG